MHWVVRFGIAAIAAGAFGAVPVFADSEPLEAGRVLYEDKCAQCHGVEGNAAVGAADRLMPRPRDFTSGSYKVRSTPSGELPTDGDLVAVIRNGMPYTAMPGWPHFSDTEVASLVATIKSFNEDFSDPEMIVPPIEIPDAPPLTEESVEKGRAVYLANKCLECHGDRGRADGPSSPTLKTDDGKAIRSADLTKRWTFRGGPRREDIYRTFTTGLNGTPMPSYADSIAEEERWQLVDYVYSLSEDEPGYGTTLVAKPVDGEIALDPKSQLFSDAAVTRFPLVGQVTDLGRNFAPAANMLELRAVYNEDVLAVQVSWNAMREGRDGSNRPDGRDPAPEGAVLSDAVALQLPSKASDGATKPYFLYGDATNPVDLFFYDAAKDTASVYLGKGEANLTLQSETGDAVRAKGVFEDGLWQVAFVLPRGTSDAEAQVRLPQATFVPIALSVWDGRAGETGNRRAITSWYDLYLEPPDTGAAYKAAGTMAAVTLIAQFLIVAGVRRSQQNQEPQQ